MAENRFAKYASQPMIPGTGPKPPPGFQSVGPGEVAPLQGGPQDPRQAAAMAAAEARARASASTPIEVGGQIAAARAKAAIEMANERAKAAIPARPTADSTRETNDAINSLMALRNQVQRSAIEFDKSQRGAGGNPNGGFLDRLGEFAPALFSDANARFDKSVAGLAPLAKQAFRTPGEGASSDRDVQLFLNMMPGRFGNDAGNVQAYRQMRSMIDDKINGKRSLLGKPPIKGAPAKSGGKQPPAKVLDWNGDWDKVP